MESEKGIKLLGLSLMFQSEVLHNGHKMETRYVLDNWTEHDWNRSECLFADQILYVCEQDSPAVYRDDSMLLSVYVF